MSDYPALDVTEVATPPAYDPDHPSWGIMTGIGVWIFSYLVPLLAINVWFVIQRRSGAALPTTREEIEAWIMTPGVVLTSVIATAVSHILTLALCWVVVTRLGSRPFLASLGWHWGGLSRSGRYLLIFGVVAAVYIINVVLVQFLPESETTKFGEMLKSSHTVRILVACMAVLTAPIVEETVYRGMLYSPLRNRLGRSAAVMIVTILFVLVHFDQYSGAWASLAGLTILSFVLTLVRAVTQSLLPCVAIHLVFNFVGSIFILQPVLQ
ncbi:MAG TPA: type II CAAX endopeptidase family protein [Blastocatellia bacterium]|nr:type II CAAX endopeptidase family protein [Blastocatellia bacterium]